MQLTGEIQRGVNKIKIAIIEDNKDQVFDIMQLLENAHFTECTVFFDDDSMALNYFDKWIYDVNLIPELILLDMNISAGKGQSFLRQLKKLKLRINKKITVCMYNSASAQAEPVFTDLEENAGLVCTPVNLNTFCNLLNQLN